MYAATRRLRASAHGTPGWIDLSTDDVEGAKAFYGGLFGWSWEDQQDPGGDFVYSIAYLEGRSVAGLGRAPSEMVEAGVRAVWNTYLVVDSVDLAHQAVLDEGGVSLVGPFDVMSAGRMAFVMDDQGSTCGTVASRVPQGRPVGQRARCFHLERTLRS